MPATTYKLVLHRQALREVQALPKPVKERVKAAIDALCRTPIPPGASRLKGTPSAYRLRVGDYRILYEVHATELVIYVVGLGHRREVYVRLLRRL